MLATFRPERFLDESPGGGAWMPLGGGIWRCLGTSFVTFEMSVVVRTVLVARPGAAAGVAAAGGVSLHAVTAVPARGARVVLD